MTGWLNVLYIAVVWSADDPIIPHLHICSNVSRQAHSNTHHDFSQLVETDWRNDVCCNAKNQKDNNIVNHQDCTQKITAEYFTIKKKKNINEVFIAHHIYVRCTYTQLVLQSCTPASRENNCVISHGQNKCAPMMINTIFSSTVVCVGHFVCACSA